MQLIANIAVLGAIYALVSCGYVLIYRVSRVLSLAHGELMMLGAYGLATTASLFTASVLVYAVLMRRMTGEAVLAAVLTTIALGILLRGLMALIWPVQDVHP